MKVLIMNYSWSGISEEKTLNPVQLATMKAERIAREKAAAAQNAAVSSKLSSCSSVGVFISDDEKKLCSR